MSSTKVFMIDIGRDGKIKVSIYNERGLKLNEIHISSDNIELEKPDFVIIAKHLMDDGMLIVAKNVRSIRPKRVLPNSGAL